MSPINSKIKDDFEVVMLLSCLVEHPVYKQNTRLCIRQYVVHGI